jgi:molybdopterin-binding protein
MNNLKGNIASITVQEKMSLVKVKSGQVLFTVIVIDTPESASYLKEGNTVNLIFKETEVIIGKGTAFAISLQNRIVGKLKFIRSGALLSKLVVDTELGEIASIITSNAVNDLGLLVGDEVTVMVKTSEMMLSEC